ncbi:Hypothetical predicted protein [Paramuricea clavata]|uniref:Endonuclease/exonuclease/phosphatase domain-containing protein n=1 Tax=Paramuricea clavata TaxID=317549 RepID=A0A7D9I932_PARCT|nr:Hypothetical predicted protein [Paramuricea clavata]
MSEILKTVRFSPDLFYKAHSPRKHVFGEENHGIKREYQQFPADLGELRNRDEQTQSWTYLVVLHNFKENGLFSYYDKVYSSIVCVFGDGNRCIGQEIQQSLILNVNLEVLLSQAEQVRICISSKLDICIMSNEQLALCLPIVAQLSVKEGTIRAKYSSFSSLINQSWFATSYPHNLPFNYWPVNRNYCAVYRNTDMLYLPVLPCQQKFFHNKPKMMQAPYFYYPNLCATRQILLKGGDISTNPGPLTQQQLGQKPISNPTAWGSRSANLVYIDCSSNLLQNGNCNLLKFCLLNSRSVRNKTADIVDYISHDCKPDIVAITETWLDKNDNAVRVELCPDGYKLCDHVREERRGGGIALLYRDSLYVDKVDAGSKGSYEFSEWIVNLSSAQKLCMVAVYRPPYTSEHGAPIGLFFTEFFSHLESLLLCKEALVICGDFNIHVDSIEDADAVKFCDLLESVGLKQYVNEATHVDGHTLDLIITRVSDYIIIGQPKVDRYISDHASVICSLATAKPILEKKLHMVIQTIKLPEEIDAVVREYNSTLTHLTDYHAPLKTKIIRARTSAPWYSAEIDTAKRQRRKAERAWRKTRREYYSDFINSNGDNKSKLFRAAKSLLNTNSEICFPNSPDNTVLSNDIGAFFVSKIARIRAEVDAMVLDSQSNKLVPDDIKFVSQRGGVLTHFRKISQEEVQILVMKSSKKYCSLDPMLTPLVMDCLDTLLPVITHLINSSLANATSLRIGKMHW